MIRKSYAVIIAICIVLAIAVTWAVRSCKAPTPQTTEQK